MISSESNSSYFPPDEKRSPFLEENTKSEENDIKFFSNNILMNFIIYERPPQETEKTSQIERISQLLSTISLLSDSEILSKTEKIHAIEDLKELNDNLKVDELEKNLTEIIHKIVISNIKSKIFVLIPELERCLCIHPKKNISSLNSDEFQEIITPLVNYLKKDLSTLDIISLERELIEIKNLLDHEEETPKIISKLKNLVKPHSAA